jgi:insulysin
MIVHHDAAQIKSLTKADMISFYSHFIHPTSAARSKLAVHLIAQSTPSPETIEKPITAAIEKGMKVLGLNKDRQDQEDGEIIGEIKKKEGNGTTPFIITDVREFKSKMQVSAGPQPVKHISEFEELDAKL